MTESAIDIQRLGKRYALGATASGQQTLRELINASVGRAWRTMRGRTAAQQRPETGDAHFWALRDISLSVIRGQSLGVIGHNGAGKSTLLKILSRITMPTTGSARIRGRVASLLEVGTGFHPELTGRENIFLNGAILGMSRAETTRKLDAIVDFSGIEGFLDTPVKRYSSGMYVRLAFAVAAHLEPEILIVDEVLAVGDAAFQKRCLGKMRDVAGSGRTVLFVSHNLGAVRALCDRAILLDAGQLIADGSPDQVIETYMRSVAGEASHEGLTLWPEDADAPGSDALTLRSVRMMGRDRQPRAAFDVNEPIFVEMAYRVHERLHGVRWHMQVLTMDGQIAFTSTDQDRQPEWVEPGEYTTCCELPAGLLNIGGYALRIGAGIPGVKRLMPVQQGFAFTTSGAGNQGSAFPEHWPGAVCPRLDWRVQPVESTKLESAGTPVGQHAAMSTPAAA